MISTEVLGRTKYSDMLRLAWRLACVLGSLIVTRGWIGGVCLEDHVGSLLVGEVVLVVVTLGIRDLVEVVGRTLVCEVSLPRVQAS